jgi:Leucine-rich repeat (LRR) protein
LTALICLDISGVTRVDATTWQSISQLQKLEVLRIKTVLSSSALSRGFASVVLPALPALSHLSLGYCYFNGRLSAAISQCSRLDSLQVSNQHHFGADDFKPFSHLTKLTFSHSTLPVGAMKYLINIDSLNLDFCLTDKRVEVSERGGGELATRCKTSFSGFRRLTTLKHLSLKACHVDDSMLRSIALASGLQSLQLSSLSKASLKGVRQVRKLKYLQTLDVSNSALVDDKAVANLAPHLGGLVDLVAANCRDLGDIAADAVSVFCPLLKNIVLFRTKITDEGIHSLARLKSLLLLDVSCCERVTTSSLYVLRAQAPRCHVNASHLEAVSGECAPNSSPCSIS